MRPTKQNSDTKTNKVHKPGMRFTLHKPHIKVGVMNYQRTLIHSEKLIYYTNETYKTKLRHQNQQSS